MTDVKAGGNESFESSLKRFNKKVQQTGILSETRRREHYEKPSIISVSGRQRLSDVRRLEQSEGSQHYYDSGIKWKQF